MTVRELTVNGFRNLHPDTVWRPYAGVNILTGNNGQGKTNLLESCWLFTGSRSFRGAKDAEMVTFGADAAALGLRFHAGGREQEAALTVSRRRTATLNGVKLPSATKLAGVFCGVVFSPAHLSLVREGPEERRRFTDAAICQLKPGYIATVAEYQKILTQRNAFLRQLADGAGGGTDADNLLDVWDMSLAAAGARLTNARARYIRKLAPLAADIYAGLSGGREQLTLTWESAVLPAADGEPLPLAQLAACWNDRLTAARAADRGAGFSTVGAHREDLSVLINGHPARVYGSQGQQRSAVLALKLAEASLLEEVSGEPPVAFLDDVMSELDVTRQDYILNHIRDWQVLITCCEPSASLRMTAGKIFGIENGVITQQ